MKKTLVYISIFCTILILILTYFYPNSSLSSVVKHYNSYSSIIIMLLTLVYVLTTTRQLNVMEKQIQLMETQNNTQIQPIIEPQIGKMHLENISIFSSPDENFMKANIMSRFFVDFTMDNVGNGSALNVVIYPTIIIDDLIIPSPYLRPDHAHCVSHNKSNDAKISLMMFDKGIEIASGILSDNVTLELNIFYKNVFGTGFNETISYRLMAYDSNAQKWKEFIDEDLDSLLHEAKKHDALKPIDEESANTISESISEILAERIDGNLDVEHYILPKSYNIKMVDYEKAINIADKRYEEHHKNYFNEDTEILLEIRENIRDINF